MLFVCVKELECLVSGWGDMPYHAPVLLAWTLLKFVTQPSVGMEVCSGGGVTIGGVWGGVTIEDEGM